MDRKSTKKEIALRLVKGKPITTEYPVIDIPSCMSLLVDEFSDYDREAFTVINLDENHKPINMSISSLGSIDSAPVHPREVFKSTLLSEVREAIIAHNHPSGIVTPSIEDITLTRKIRECAIMLGIKIVDHVIVGDGKYYSFRLENLVIDDNLPKELEDIYMNMEKEFRTSKSPKEYAPSMELKVAESQEEYNKYDFEIVETRLNSRPAEEKMLRDSESVAKYVRAKFHDAEDEVLFVIDIDSKLKPISIEVMDFDSDSSYRISEKPISKIYTDAILSNSKSVCFGRYIPKENISEQKLSNDDIKTLIKASQLSGIHLIDYVDVAINTQESYREKGTLGKLEEELRLSVCEEEPCYFYDDEEIEI